MKSHSHVFHCPLSGFSLSSKIMFRRLVTNFFSLACILCLNLVMLSAGSKSVPLLSRDVEVSMQQFAGGLPGLDPQNEIEVSGFRINVDAFNAKRKLDIAKDSRKLLSLAIAVKSELDQAPHSLSADTVKKLKQIEKLAHAVKEKMSLNPGSP